MLQCPAHRTLISEALSARKWRSTAETLITKLHAKHSTGILSKLELGDCRTNLPESTLQIRTRSICKPPLSQHHGNDSL